MTIERLIVVFQAGDHREEIFQEIHRRYHGSIRLFFGRKGFSAEDCRDLAQETFLRLWRSLERFRGDSKFVSWLYTIAGNVWRNEVSKQKAKKNDGEGVPFDESVDHELSGAIDVASRGFAEPLSELLSKEEAVVLRQELERLPPRMRRILVLRLDQDLKFREIGKHEQVSINTVKSQLARAKARLRPCLAGYLGKTDATESEESNP